MLKHAPHPGRGGDADDFAVRLGRRMRQVRRQVGYSLGRAAEELGQGWAYSTIAGYEQSKRAITPERLAVLARLYGVPVKALLPEDTAGHQSTLTFDIGQLRQLDTPQVGPLLGYLRTVQQLRNDYTERLTLRDGDLPILAALYGTTPDGFLGMLNRWTQGPIEWDCAACGTTLMGAPALAACSNCGQPLEPESAAQGNRRGAIARRRRAPDSSVSSIGLA